jgi:PAS domain-containing protein
MLNDVEDWLAVESVLNRSICGGSRSTSLPPPKIHQKRAVISMTLVKEYAHKLLDAAPDAMIIADSCGSIIYANHHAATLFGYLKCRVDWRASTPRYIALHIVICRRVIGSAAI